MKDNRKHPRARSNGEIEGNELPKVVSCITWRHFYLSEMQKRRLATINRPFNVLLRLAISKIDLGLAITLYSEV